MWEKKYIYILSKFLAQQSYDGRDAPRQKHLGKLMIKTCGGGPWAETA